MLSSCATVGKRQEYSGAGTLFSWMLAEIMSTLWAFCVYLENLTSIELWLDATSVPQVITHHIIPSQHHIDRDGIIYLLPLECLRIIQWIVMGIGDVRRASIPLRDDVALIHKDWPPDHSHLVIISPQIFHDLWLALNPPVRECLIWHI